MGVPRRRPQARLAPIYQLHTQNMLARAATRPACRAASAGAARSFSTSGVQQANLKELETRLKSVRNIEKVTKSMKMIATTRLGKAQDAMRKAQEYGAANGVIFDEAKAAEAIASEDGGESGNQKTLWIVCSSDRGLCGGIHSSVSKKFRREATLNAPAEEQPLVVLGDKAKAQLSRATPQSFVLSFNQLGKAVPSFADACAITELIEENKVNFDNVKLIYNKVVSPIAYEADIMEVYNASSLTQAPNFSAYEVEDENVVKDLADFAVTNAIYCALAEGYAAEVSARRNAMDNASKNAGEMMNKLQLKYNRMRQAQITNDLVDIVTGANALG